MKQIIVLVIAGILGVISLCYYSFSRGQKDRQDEIEARVIQTNQEHYSKEEVETLLFNEKQE